MTCFGVFLFSFTLVPPVAKKAMVAAQDIRTGQLDAGLGSGKRGRQRHARQAGAEAQGSAGLLSLPLARRDKQGDRSEAGEARKKRGGGG